MLSTQSEGTPLTHAEPAHHLVGLLGWCGHAVRNSIQPPMTHRRRFYPCEAGPLTEALRPSKTRGREGPRRTAQIRSRLITTPQRALIAVSLAIARHRSARRSLAHHPAWQAEHHEVGIVATEVIWPRRDRQAIREPAHSLVVHNAAHLVGRQRDVVRPLAAQVCKVDLALARHRRCTAISRQASTCTPSFTSTGRRPLNVSHYS